MRGDDFSSYLEALDCVSPLLEVQSDRGTGKVLIKFHVKCMVFSTDRVSGLPPMSFQLKRFHFCSEVMGGGGSDRGERGYNHLYSFIQLL